MLLLFSPAWADPPPDVATHVAALPNVGFDTDDGLGLGGRLEITRVKAGVDPYLASYVVQLYASLDGYHHHRFHFDLPHLGQEGNTRLTGHFAYRAWLNDGYWGMGNSAPRDPNIDDDFYHYTLIQPFSRLTLSQQVWGPLSIFGALEGRWSKIEAEENSLLAQEQPYGMAGGTTLQIVAGISVDTRDVEVTPTRGGVIEIAVRGAPPLPGGIEAGVFGGVFTSLRGFVQVAPKLTLGARWMNDYLFGDVPFYEMVSWGGWAPISGMGGSDSLRGISFGRFHGPGKTVLQSEARIDVWETSLLKRPFRLQCVPLLDVGAVYGASEAQKLDAFPLHPGAGMGLRAIFDTTLVGRLDAAVGWDPIEGGGVAPELGIYLVFDHTF